LVTKGLIKPVVEHNRQLIYTRAIAAVETVQEEQPSKQAGKKAPAKGKKAAATEEETA
jgi:hypothetical protein